MQCLPTVDNASPHQLAGLTAVFIDFVL